MSFPVLICDDSALARKQMARSLPATLNADITFAIHGKNALEELEKNEYDNHILDKVLDNHNNPTKWIDALEYLNNLEGKIEVINLILNPNEKENEINW